MFKKIATVITLILLINSCEVSNGILTNSDSFSIIQVRITNSSVNGWIVVDGFRIDRSSPDTFRIAPGIHRISLYVPGYQVSPEYQDVVAESGKFIEVEFTVQEIPTGDLKIVTQPPGAEVYLDNILMGITPLTLQGIKIGEHFIQISKSGFKSEQERISIDQNSLIELHKKLNRQKIFLIEDFSNTGCPPCPQADARIKKIENELDSLAIEVISYHPNFPSPADPFYQLAPEDILGRVSYYGINSTPSVFLNGEKIVFFSFDDLESQLKQKILEGIQDTSARINLEAVIYYRDALSIKGIVKIQNMNAADFQGLVYAAILQEGIHFQEPPGTNGQKDFYHIFTGFLDEFDGAELRLNQGQQIQFNFQHTIDQDLSNNWKIVFFIQNDQKQIENIAVIE